MIFTIEEARDILRIDGSDNDGMIYALLSAIPPYLEATTGYQSPDGTFSPLAQTAGRFSRRRRNPAAAEGGIKSGQRRSRKRRRKIPWRDLRRTTTWPDRKRSRSRVRKHNS